MKAVVVEKPGVVHVDDVSEVKIDEYQALVRTLACAICNGTDRKILRGTIPFLPPDIYPGILGHESVGRVVRAGSKVSSFREGDLVFRTVADVEGYSCFWGGLAELGAVTDLKALQADGMEPDGRPFHPGQQVIPREVDPLAATVCITLKEVMSYLRALGVSAGKSLLVLGYGPVGLSCVYLAKIIGMGPVIAAGRREEGLRVAESFGADEIIDTGREKIDEKVKSIARDGVSFVVDAIGSADLVSQAAAALHPEGKMGLYAIIDRGSPERSNARNVVPVNPDEHNAHDEIMQLWSDGRIRPDRFVTHALPMDDIAAAFDLIEKRQAIKVVMNVGG